MASRLSFLKRISIGCRRYQARAASPSKPSSMKRSNDNLTPPKKTIGNYIVPTGEPDSPEEEAELAELAQTIGTAHPWPSEMVIEDRGPR